MTISDAARKGCLIGGQARAIFKSIDGTTCFWGAVIEGLGKTVNDIIRGGFPSVFYARDVDPLYVWADEMLVSCPTAVSCKARESSVTTMSMHLNDAHLMSREAIALWVEEQKKIWDETGKIEYTEVKRRVEEQDVETVCV